MIVFRKIKEEDLPMLLEWRQNSVISEFMSPVENDLEKQKEWWQKENPIHKYRIMSLDKDVGAYSLNNIDHTHKRCEIGGYVMPEFQRTSVATRATKAIQEYVFTKMNFNKIYVKVIEDNLPCLTMLQKCGFQVEGKLKEFTYLNDKFHDTCFLGLTKNEWNSQPELYFFEE